MRTVEHTRQLNMLPTTERRTLYYRSLKWRQAILIAVGPCDRCPSVEQLWRHFEQRLCNGCLGAAEMERIKGDSGR